ncbi:RES family NAD+ phosphorylase [Photorhabdus bodei]|uniref:RES domain-containing protein n=1 Tax=Photorhabdus bodei TaxID=2029681 RepID=A0ABX0AMY0_9GAMM|nr:RES family NAD+ phosphorylase [Photorhabdus bodei]NDK98924.1 RES domain-containing protein [Photorhabdus bodei]NDL03268.1 RES domain-containing protein [Photorhabdus bodei]NDL07382.1 RES domain-containing protein [Photorhabdus bodei]
MAVRSELQFWRWAIYTLWISRCIATARERIPGSIDNYVTGVSECSQQRGNLKDDGYNSPDNSFRVCYMADRAVTALAESYGRLWHKEGLRFIDESEIRTARMCNIRSLRKLVFIDIAKLIGMLHIPLSVMVDEDYSVTKRAMACLYELLNNEMDGICYISRHWPTDFCYAVWEKREDRFVDAGMQSLVNYRDSEYMPSTWNEPDISADELLEEVLNFKIIRLE